MNANGNLTSGNGLTLAYSAANKPASITRGTTSLSFGHDPDHQRYKQIAPGSTTLYLAAGGVLAEKVTGGSVVQWNNYLVTAAGMIGMRVERSDGGLFTRYFHKDHLGSIAVLTDDTGAVVERLSYDAWGKRRHPNGADDPAGKPDQPDHARLHRPRTTRRRWPGAYERARLRSAPGALRHARSDDGEPVLDARLEPLFLCGQQPAQLH